MASKSKPLQGAKTKGNSKPSSGTIRQASSPAPLKKAKRPKKKVLGRLIDSLFYTMLNCPDSHSLFDKQKFQELAKAVQTDPSSMREYTALREAWIDDMQTHFDDFISEGKLLI